VVGKNCACRVDCFALNCGRGRLLCVELRAGDGELRPGMEDFGGLDDDSISWWGLCRGVLLMLV